MADRPILFSGPMVRALLAGTKTQTRRVLNPQPNMLNGGLPLNNGRGLYSTDAGWKRYRPAIGDRLWVREAHAIFDAHGQHRDDGQRWGPWGGLPTQLSTNRTQIAYFREGFDRCRSGRWRPGIHMPRWASRLTLIVTDVRVEHLQDITEADAITEGVDRAYGFWRRYGETPRPFNGAAPTVLTHGRVVSADPRHSYATLWDTLNSKRGFGWDTNPWVVALTFTVEQRNIDAPPPPSVLQRTPSERRA